MDLNSVIKVILIGICLFALIFFVFGLAKVDWDTNVDEVLKIYKSELIRVKNELNEGNKKIDNIEKEIYNCKKKLNKK